MKKEFVIGLFYLLGWIIPAVSQTSVGDFWTNPAEVYVGIGQTFTTEVRVNTGTKSLGAYTIDFRIHGDVIKLESWQAVSPDITTVVGMGTTDNFTVSAFSIRGLAPGTNQLLITLRFKAYRSGASYIDIAPTYLTDINTIAIGVPRGISGVVHVAPTGKLWADANSDNQVSIIDALLVAQASLGKIPAGFNAAVADVNCDGSITIIDALLIAQYGTSLLPAFPCRGLPTPPPTTPPISFPDPNLEKEIRLDIDKLAGNLYREDVMNEKELFIHNVKIANLSGLEYLTSLTSFYLIQIDLIDLTPLAALTNLNTLDLYINKATDLTPLLRLTGLTTLYLDNNDLETMPSLGSLINLKNLNLNENNLRDLTFLSGLKSLTYLSLVYNQITDITPLFQLSNLKTLNLTGNPVAPADITALKNALPNTTITF